MADKRTFQCSKCQHEWQEPFGTGRPEGCPECKGTDFMRTDSLRGLGGGLGTGGGRGGRRVRDDGRGKSNVASKE